MKMVKQSPLKEDNPMYNTGNLYVEQNLFSLRLQEIVLCWDCQQGIWVLFGHLNPQKLPLRTLKYFEKHF